MLKEEKKKLNEKKPGVITCQESKKSPTISNILEFHLFFHQGAKEKFGNRSNNKAAT